MDLGSYCSLSRTILENLTFIVQDVWEILKLNSSPLVALPGNRPVIRHIKAKNPKRTYLFVEPLQIL